MSDDPVDLDEHRSEAAKKATEIRRRRLTEFQADQKALRQRQEELENLLLATSGDTWPEAAAKAQYLIQLYATTPDAQEPRRKELVARVLDDIARLCERAKESPA
jgi:phage terminase Nu1 subunit (DNA packaging protein)